MISIAKFLHINGDTYGRQSQSKRELLVLLTGRLKVQEPWLRWAWHSSNLDDMSTPILGIPKLLFKPKSLFASCWTRSALHERGWRGTLKMAWRVIATTWHGMNENRLQQQSAGLTYYTLMSLGPVLALALTISGFILSSNGSTGDNPAKRAIVSAVEYIAPQIAAHTSLPGHQTTLREINKDLDGLVDRLLANAASSQAGIIGLLLIIGLAVLMLSRVEDALNGIWGVRTGRSWRDRFTNYLLFFVLFFLVGATTLVMLSAASLASLINDGTTWFNEYLQLLPGGDRLTTFIHGNGPFLISLVLLTLVFGAFNRMMPNVRVHWNAALVGGFVVSLLVIINHHLAAVYVDRVSQLQSLYGELSIVLVLMFGIFLSCFFVLIGGQIAYAFQNRRALARRKSWEGFSHRARRALSFISIAEVLRRYRTGRPGPTSANIAELTRVPVSVADGCLLMLREMNLLAAEKRTGGHIPARPLEAMTVSELWEIVDSYADNHAADPDLTADPAARELANIEANLLAQKPPSLQLGELASRVEST